MGVFNENAIIGTSAASAGGGYDIDNSCRFNSADSAYMHFTPSGHGNRRTFTLSFWFKIHIPQTNQTVKTLMSAGSSSKLAFQNNAIYSDVGGATIEGGTVMTRDPSAWKHYVMKVDTTQANAADRLVMYANGNSLMEYMNAIPAALAQNEETEFNQALAQKWGTNNSPGYYWDGYLAEVHMVDGLALDPTSFGERGDYGEWKPIEYTGAHGTNGYHLNFKNAGVVYASGDRSSDITVTSNMTAPSGGLYGGAVGAQMVDGVIGSGSNWGFQNGANQTGHYIRFGWATPQTITSARWYCNTTSTQGTWKWQGSNVVGGATGYVDIGSSFSLALNGWTTLSSMNANTTAYLYYQMIGVSGTGSSAGDQYEIEFGYGTPAANGLGTDAAGSNHFTLVNINTHDQVKDSPTNNWCTLNPLNIAHSGLHEPELSEGNLYITGPSNGHHQGGVCGTLYTSNKIYYEFYLKILVDDSMHWGIAPDDYYPSSLTANNAVALRPGKTNAGIIAHGVSTDIDYANTYYDGSSTVSTSGYPVCTQGQIVSVAFDPATGKYWFARNNVWQGGGNPATGTSPIATLTNLNHTWTANVSAYGAQQAYVVNFGQDGTFAGNVAAGGYSDENDYGNFKYPVPAGFLSLCSKNQTDCSVTPSEHFNTQIWSGNNARTISTEFQPDLAWIKCRSSGNSHELLDTIRGATKRLRPEDSSQEYTEGGGLTAFTSTGYTLGSNNGYNASGQTYVSWNWKAGGTGSSNTDGSINTTSTTVNTDAGFSISTYTGNGVDGSTVGHGLSVKPNLVIVKQRTGANNGWIVGSVQPAGFSAMDFTDNMYLDSTSALEDNDTRWSDDNPTASVFTIGTNNECNQSGSTYVAYCFHSVEGYSKIGCYLGNGVGDNVTNSNNGPFIYTGFSPAFVMIKRTDAAGKNWQMFDKARDPVNDGNQRNLKANAPDAEDGGSLMDFLSNGFTTKTTNSEFNGSGGKYLYLAFASIPFKNSNAV